MSCKHKLLKLIKQKSITKTVFLLFVELVAILIVIIGLKELLLFKKRKRSISERAKATEDCFKEKSAVLFIELK